LGGEGAQPETPSELYITSTPKDASITGRENHRQIGEGNKITVGKKKKKKVKEKDFQRGSTRRKKPGKRQTTVQQKVP